MPHLYEVALSKERFTKHDNLLTLYLFFFFFLGGFCTLQVCHPSCFSCNNKGGEQLESHISSSLDPA